MNFFSNMEDYDEYIDFLPYSEDYLQRSDDEDEEFEFNEEDEEEEDEEEYHRMINFDNFANQALREGKLNNYHLNYLNSLRKMFYKKFPNYHRQVDSALILAIENNIFDKKVVDIMISEEILNSLKEMAKKLIEKIKNKKSVTYNELGLSAQLEGMMSSDDIDVNILTDLLSQAIIY